MPVTFFLLTERKRHRGENQERRAETYFGQDDSHPFVRINGLFQGWRQLAAQLDSPLLDRKNGAIRGQNDNSRWVMDRYLISKDNGKPRMYRVQTVGEFLTLARAFTMNK